MPEAAELHLSSRFINNTCRGRLFHGRVKKTEVSKSADVNWDAGLYTITARSRGKEVKLTLTAHRTETDPSTSKNETTRDSHSCTSLKTEIDSHKTQNMELNNGSLDMKNIKPDPEKTTRAEVTAEVKAVKAEVESPTTVKTEPDSEQQLDIVFRFGMSGKFRFDPVEDIQKHAHLNFFTADGEMVLSFVDPRRFGRWGPGVNWSKERGPCPLTESQAFRENIRTHLDLPLFDKPICEVLLNQQFFNGIGNYLRAEILYRAGVPPFVSARTALEPLAAKAEEDSDILSLCHKVPSEVVELFADSTGAYMYDRDVEEFKLTTFSDWLQCYYKPGMKSIKDRHSRTMWFSGEPGPLAPKEKETTKGKKTKREKAQKPGSAKKKKLPAKSSTDKPSKIEAPHTTNQGQEKVTKRVTRSKVKGMTSAHDFVMPRTAQTKTQKSAKKKS